MKKIGLWSVFPLLLLCLTVSPPEAQSSSKSTEAISPAGTVAQPAVKPAPTAKTPAHPVANISGVTGAVAKTGAELKSIRLEELDILLSRCGWKSPQAGKSIDGLPLAINGKVYKYGLGTHAPALIVIQLSGGKGRFRAKFGVNDTGGKPGSIELLINGDQKLLWRSGVVRGFEEPKSVDIALDGIKELILTVSPVEKYFNDHVALVDAVIEYTGAKPKILSNQEIIFDASGNRIDRYDENATEWFFTERLIKDGLDPEAVQQALHPASTILKTDRDPLDVALRRLDPLVEHLLQQIDANELTAEQKALADLKKKAEAIPVDQPQARKALFAEVTALRRKIALKNPLLDFSDILFIKRKNCVSAEQRGNHMCDQYFGFNALDGGGLFVLKNAFSEKPTTINLLAGLKVAKGRVQGTELDQSWGFLSPELSYNGKEIFFAATDTKGPRHTFVWSNDNCYHLFKVAFDSASGKTSQLEQITDGAVNDFDPCCLPNGRIAFISERRGGFGRCHPRIVPTYTLHSVNPDGSDIVTLSWHETNEWAPSVDRNGMIVYTRWDYVDRGANNAHHPWITTPDGHDARALQGNFHEQKARTPIMELDVRNVPNSHKLTATAAGHHGESYGSLLLIDPQVPDDYLMSTVRRITPNQLFPESELSLAYDQPARYATCYPLSEQFYLCVFDPFGLKGNGPGNRYGIYLLDAFGNHVLLYRDRQISCRDVIPLKARDLDPIVPSKTLRGRPLAKGESFKPLDETKIPKTAKVGVVNIYDSTEPFPEGVKIERLRIVQILPKTTPYGDTPRIGYGDQKNARQILGTVPVEDDGSAWFELPVETPVYFQALDKEGRAIQSMRSDTYAHAGPDLVCQGCHENRLTATTIRPTYPKAMRREPSKIKPDPDGTYPMNFVRLIQPILNEKCVACHTNSKDPKAIDLSDEPKREHFSNAFKNLKKYCFFYNHYLWDEPRTVPNQFGANRSPLYKILKSDHYGVKLTSDEMYRFMLWMDNNCDFYGSYDDIDLQRAGNLVTPRLH